MQRLRVCRLLKESPSLQPVLTADLPEIYAEARLMAAKQTGIGDELFPPACPYALDEILGAKPIVLS